MGNEPTTASPASPSLQATRVYAMAAICLVTGLGIGYLLRLSQSVPSPAQMAGGDKPSSAVMKVIGPGQPQTAANPAQPSAPGSAMSAGKMPTLDDMKRMADKQAAPLLEKLKSDPKNSLLLSQVAAIYHTTHQFQEAAVYYSKAVEFDPKDVALRNKWAASLYRSGDVDGAITQLNRALKIDPKDANALFNLGLIKLDGKKDSKGALAAWQQLLKSNPQLSPDRKAAVQKQMAEALTMLSDQNGMKGAESNGGNNSNSR